MKTIVNYVLFLNECETAYKNRLDKQVKNGEFSNSWKKP